MLLKYIEYIKEYYEFKTKISRGEIIYRFINKFDSSYIVIFKKNSVLTYHVRKNFNNDDSNLYEMEFNKNAEWMYKNGSFDYTIPQSDIEEFNKPKKTIDVFNVYNTIKNIILDFIKKYKPELIVIAHTNTEEEDKKGVGFNHPYWKKHLNKRSKINKEFLENSLPKEYEYKLFQNITYIVKKGKKLKIKDLDNGKWNII